MEVEKTLIRTPVKLKTKMKAIAKKKGLTLNALILIILDDWISKHEEK